MNVLTVVGNRPQFIKSAPLVVALRCHGLTEITVHTGQHYDAEMSAVFFDDLGLPQPQYRLDLRTSDVDAMRVGLRRVMRGERPNLVIVFGDTNSTLAGALAGRELGIDVAHVEAGLRSGDLTMPEERNRIEVDLISQMLFAPDERSKEQLNTEGVSGSIEVVGDVMADATRLFLASARERYGTPREPGTYVLATIHRQANTEERRLRRIISGLAALDLPVVFTAHPRTKKAVEEFGLTVGGNVELCAPMGYLEFTAALAGAALMVTDSGGVQKEAYWLGVPCVTTRPSTEWIDTVLVGANTLVDDDPERIVEAARVARMPEAAPTLYGDGRASQRIAEILDSH